jgi:heme-degrading monooxygenase HmoA
LREAGVSLSDVVRLNIYTTDVDRFFEVYGAAGRLAEAGCHPASTLLGVTRLAYPEMLVEIEATAVLYRPERSTKKPPGRDNPNRAGAAPVGYKVGPGSFGAFGSERAGAPKIIHLGDALSLGRCQYDGAVGTTRQGKAGVRRHAAMHARMSILEGPTDQVDEGMRYVREQVLPLMQQQDGFKGFIVLNDRQSGKIIGVSFWESEQAMQASEEVGNRTRSESAETVGGTVAGVERYEVGVFEMSS